MRLELGRTSFLGTQGGIDRVQKLQLNTTNETNMFLVLNKGVSEHSWERTTAERVAEDSGYQDTDLKMFKNIKMLLPLGEKKDCRKNNQ